MIIVLIVIYYVLIYFDFDGSLGAKGCRIAPKLVDTCDMLNCCAVELLCGSKLKNAEHGIH